MIMNLGSFALMLIANALLMLSQSQNLDRVLGARAAEHPQRTLRWTAWILIILASSILLLIQGIEFGLLIALLHFALSAATVSLLLAYRPKLLYSVARRLVSA